MKANCHFRIFFLFAWFFFNLSGVSLAQKKSIFEVLTSQEVPRMTLEADITTIREMKKTNQYFPATLTTADGKAYRVELKPRGKYRRKVSEIPPLKIKFKKKELLAEGLDSLNEIKLVLPCYDSDLGDQLLIKEYLCYRMFEHLSGASVRGRLIKLNIRDTHVEHSKQTMYAMLLEDEEETCARLNGIMVEDYGIPADSFITHQAALAVIFEYFIGNTDWEIAMLRNVRLVKTRESGKILVIPYDFDFSGFVSAPYATPASETGLRNVRDRFLMSSGLKQEALKKASQTLRSAQKDLFDICRSKYLDSETAEKATRYLQVFFDHLEGKKDVPQMIKMPSD